jgi:hypothetical protein
MSLNKFTNIQKGIDLKLDIGCRSMSCDTIVNPGAGLFSGHDILARNKLEYLTGDTKLVNLSTPDRGQPDFSLHTDGLGSTFWAPDQTGSGDITYAGTFPAEVGRHLISSTSLGTSATESKLYEDATNLDVGALNITNVGLVDGEDISSLSTQQGTNTTNISNNTSAISDRLKLDGTDVMGGTLQMNTNSITGVVNINGVVYPPPEISDPLKLSIDGLISMTGDLKMGSYNITNVGLVDGEDVSVMSTNIGLNTTAIGNNASAIVDKLDKDGISDLKISKAISAITLKDTVSIGNSNAVIKLTDSLDTEIGSITSDAGCLCLKQGGVSKLEIGATETKFTQDLNMSSNNLAGVQNIRANNSNETISLANSSDDTPVIYMELSDTSVNSYLDLNMNGFNITNAAEIQAIGAQALKLFGAPNIELYGSSSAGSGTIELKTNTTSVYDVSTTLAPSTGDNLCNKTYVDGKAAEYLPLTGGTLTSTLMIDATTPLLELTDTNNTAWGNGSGNITFRGAVGGLSVFIGELNAGLNFGIISYAPTKNIVIQTNNKAMILAPTGDLKLPGSLDMSGFNVANVNEINNRLADSLVLGSSGGDYPNLDSTVKFDGALSFWQSLDLNQRAFYNPPSSGDPSSGRGINSLTTFNAADAIEFDVIYTMNQYAGNRGFVRLGIMTLPYVDPVRVNLGTKSYAMEFRHNASQVPVLRKYRGSGTTGGLLNTAMDNITTLTAGTTWVRLNYNNVSAVKQFEIQFSNDFGTTWAVGYSDTIDDGTYQFNLSMYDGGNQSSYLFDWEVLNPGSTVCPGDVALFVDSQANVIKGFEGVLNGVSTINASRPGDLKIQRNSVDKLEITDTKVIVVDPLEAKNGITQFGGILATPSPVNSGFYSQVADKIILFTQGDLTSPETSLFNTTGAQGTLVIPANAVQVGSSYKVILSGFLFTNGTEDITFKVYLNGNTVPLIAQTGAESITSTAGASVFWKCEINYTVRTIGATGSIMLSGLFYCSKQDTLNSSGSFILPSGAVTINTTIDQTLDITGQWAATKTSNITCQTANIRSIY